MSHTQYYVSLKSVLHRVEICCFMWPAFRPTLYFSGLLFKLNMLL